MCKRPIKFYAGDSGEGHRGVAGNVCVLVFLVGIVQSKRMVRLIGAAVDIRAVKALSVLRQGQLLGLVAGKRIVDLVAPPGQHGGAAGGLHAQRAGLESGLKIDVAVLDAGEQAFQVLHVGVRHVDVLVQQLGDLDGRLHRLDLHDLLRRGGVAVDGNLAHGLAVCDALRQRRELCALAVLADIQRHQLAVGAQKPGGRKGLQVLPRPGLVAGVKLGQRRHQHLRRGLRIGGDHRDRHRAQHHKQRQEQAKRS